MPNENLTGGYGLSEACGSENLMLGAFLAGFGKTNARAPTVAGLVCPRIRQQRNDGGGCATMRAKDRKQWRALVYICNWMSFTRSFLLGTVFFRTVLPRSGGYHLKRGGMPLHDAVGINFKKGATTENQGSGVKYVG